MHENKKKKRKNTQCPYSPRYKDSKCLGIISGETIPIKTHDSQFSS